MESWCPAWPERIGPLSSTSVTQMFTARQYSFPGDCNHDGYKTHTRPSQKDLGCVVYPLNNKSLRKPDPLPCNLKIRTETSSLRTLKIVTRNIKKFFVHEFGFRCKTFSDQAKILRTASVSEKMKIIFCYYDSLSAGSMSMDSTRTMFQNVLGAKILMKKYIYSRKS
jgi:hypothetical protein